MSQQENTMNDAFAPERLAEASVWMTRLHGDGRNRALEDALRKWLQASPQNAQAFELATELWEDTHNLRRVMPIGRSTGSRWVGLRFPILAVAGAAVVAVIAFGFLLISRHSAVSTRVGEQRLLTLEDGSRVFLNTSTQIRVKYDQRMRAIEFEGGEALFDVARQPERPFVVHAGDRSIVALGTSFVVRYDRSTTAVTLVEGKVAVRMSGAREEQGQSPQVNIDEAPTPKRGVAKAAPSAQSITLTPGQRLQLTVDAVPEIDRPSIVAATAWRRGQVILDETPLSEAVEEMNRYSHLKLSVRDPAVAHLQISGLFQAGDSVTFANAIAKAYGLRTSQQRDGEIEIASLSP